MLGRVAVVVLVLILSLGSAPARANSKYAAIVVDHATGDVLHSRRADVPLYPASLTKMMTLFMLFEAIERGDARLDGTFSVSRRAAGMPASKLGLKAGSSISVEQAIKALTVRSANDVAVVIAEALGGSESRFAEMMTRRARQLGMSGTTFKNASGLPNSQQKSTARDMATLSQRLIRSFPQYYHYFSAQSVAFAGKTYRSHNRLNASYDGMDGLKTGYTRASGFNLASSATRNGQRVIVVVFGGRTAQSRDAEVARLMDLGFERLHERGPAPLVAALPVPRPGTLMAGASEVVAAGPAVPLPRPDMSAADAAAEMPASVLDVLPEDERDAIVRVVAQGAEAALASLAEGPAKAPASGDYAVQVGAFHNPDMARRAAHNATGLVPEILLLGDIDISPLPGRRQLVYRARVAGFDREIADEACSLLQSHRQECFVVRVGPRDGTG